MATILDISDASSSDIDVQTFATRLAAGLDGVQLIDLREAWELSELRSRLVSPVQAESSG